MYWFNLISLGLHPLTDCRVCVCVCVYGKKGPLLMSSAQKMVPGTESNEKMGRKLIEFQSQTEQEQIGVH